MANLENARKQCSAVAMCEIERLERRVSVEICDAPDEAARKFDGVKVLVS
jgi:hypothetical protein